MPSAPDSKRQRAVCSVRTRPAIVLCCSTRSRKTQLVRIGRVFNVLILIDNVVPTLVLGGEAQWLINSAPSGRLAGGQAGRQKGGQFSRLGRPLEHRPKRNSGDSYRRETETQIQNKHS